MKNLAMLNAQLELSLKAPAASPSRVRRATRAQWWFHHMREVVDHAINYPPARQTTPDFEPRLAVHPANSR